MRYRVLAFLGQAYSENGQPSSSRIVSSWLSISSMALIWWMVRHAMELQDPVKLATWIGSLPGIIYALATFAISPYGVTKVTGIWANKDKPAEPEAKS